MIQEELQKWLLPPSVIQIKRGCPDLLRQLLKMKIKKY